MNWMEALGRPGPTFLAASVRRLREPDGALGATREALAFLAPRIGWADYGAHVPLGLVGLRAVWRMSPILSEASFHRALGLQLAMAAREGRAAHPLSLEPQAMPALWPDMATLGFKPVFAQHFADLDLRLGEVGDRDPLVAHLAGIVAPDTFWHRLATRRLEASPAPLPEGGLVEAILDRGVVEAMDRLVAHVREGHAPASLLEPLVEAACLRLLDAERELEGKTTWLLVYLAALAEASPVDPRPWLQAAALVNFFPGREPEFRELAARSPRRPTTLLDAVLDGDAEDARFLAEAAGGGAWTVLAEAATRNDPAFNHGRQVLAVAAALDLVSRCPSLQEKLAGALAKSLANSQGSCDQALLLDRLLGTAAERLPG